MHNAALIGEQFKDAKEFGWTNTGSPEHQWETLRSSVSNHIKVEWIVDSR
jgi:hypothetical protein